GRSDRRAAAARWSADRRGPAAGARPPGANRRAGARPRPGPRWSSGGERRFDRGLEVGVAGADLVIVPEAHDAAPIDHEGHRDGRGCEFDRGRLARVEPQREGQAVLFPGRDHLRTRRVLVDAEADELDPALAVLAVDRLELRELGEAG